MGEEEGDEGAIEDFVPHAAPAFELGNVDVEEVVGVEDLDEEEVDCTEDEGNGHDYIVG